MSVNRYMHPRNIYRIPPNFKQLAIEFPEFKKHVKQDISGKITIDFKDVKALRALTCTLLKKDFGLDVEIPLNKMIPTVPLRLNYILWIEDLLNISGKTTYIRGIDIGTGASCIYCLLGAKTKGWNMLGTDIDEESIIFAHRNVDRNLLNNLIRVKLVKDETLLKEAIGNTAVQYDFCMCNPPFFSTTQELNPSFKARRPDRPRPKNAFCSSTTEVVHTGGEVEFIKKLITESKDFRQQVRIYTTMVGHKSSLPELKATLRKMDVISFKETEFCQGNTTRWGLAWTYCDIDLRKIPIDTVTTSRKQKHKPLVFKLENPDISFEEFVKKILDVFHELKVNIEEIVSNKKKRGFCITAFTNTWSHQRRKRRERELLKKVLNSDNQKDENGTKSETDVNLNQMEGQASSTNDSSFTSTSSDGTEHCDIQNTTDLIENLRFASSKEKMKRECDDNMDSYYNNKKVKIDDTGGGCLVKSVVDMYTENSVVVLEMSYVEGSCGKEGVHQIMQYIKNNWNK